jgi:putative transposase
MRLAQDALATAPRTLPVNAVCAALAVPRSSMYHLASASTSASTSASVSASAPRGLTIAERDAVLALLNSERFVDDAPRQVYARLLDEDRLVPCHWRTMYRILHAEHQVRERRNLRRHPVYAKPTLMATGPNQAWSWDITKLRTPDKWTFLNAYVVLDVFSRYITGWMVAEVESGDLAATLIATACQRHGIGSEQLTLHADNGAPMKAKTVCQLLIDLGVVESHSRPHTSNDNPFSEAGFKTMKYRPDYPDDFVTADDARAWMRRFVTWYNHQHRHSALGLLTPADVHFGRIEAVVAQRQAVLDAAFAAHPERFPRGRPLAQRPPSVVYLNPHLPSQNLPLPAQEVMLLPTLLL